MEKIDKELFRSDAKFMVDVIFDKGFFNDGMTRDAMKIFEDILTMNMYHKYKSYVQGQKLLNSIKALQEKKD